MNPKTAVAQLRHLYKQLLAGEVRDTTQAARGLLGPAIEALESAEAERDYLKEHNAQTEAECLRLAAERDVAREEHQRELAAKLRAERERDELRSAAVARISAVEAERDGLRAKAAALESERDGLRVRLSAEYDRGYGDGLGDGEPTDD